MISVVIPAHNAARTLDECLQAIHSSDYADYEVIVVDDASTDDTRHVASRHTCRVVRLPQNVGAARAKNLGVSEAEGDIILFTDADILLQPDTLGLVAQNLEDPTVAGVVGLLGQRLRYNNFCSQFKNLWMYHTYARLARSKDAEGGVGLFYTSIAAIRKGVFEHMGGFDAHYRGASVTEDIEFGQRLLTAGHKVRLDGRLAVEHLKHYSLPGLLKTDLQRAFGLAKTWLRKKLEPAQRAAGQKYYASVPWFFMLGIPLAWLLPVLVVLALWSRQAVWALLSLLDYAAILLLNAPFLNTLYQARGWIFLLQCFLFLPVDLWVSGLGALWAVLDFLRGNRY
jgi:glycosyltransferase involved in cell wall biosynthesis